MRYPESSIIGGLVAVSLTLPCSQTQYKGFYRTMDGRKVAMDSIGGAAGFMALATVGVYAAISSTCIYP